MVKLVDLDHKWAKLIGRTFVAFGSIEKSSYEYLESWVSSKVFTHIKGMGLAKRLGLLLDLCEEQDYEDIDDLIEYFKEAKELSKKRNIIAHNPLVLTLYEGDDKFTEIIQSIKKENIQIELEELMEITRKSEVVASNLISYKINRELKECEVKRP